MSQAEYCIPQNIPSTDCNTLAKCCAGNQLHSTDEFCFAVFQRAVASKQETCWTFIFIQYRSLIAGWIRFRMGKEDNILGHTVDDLVQDTLLKFWRSYTAEKIARANGLGSVLSYLKSCAATSVLEEHRRAQSRPREDKFDTGIISPQNVEQIIIHTDQTQDLDEKLVSLCKNEQEIVVARCGFLQEMSPRDIMSRYPDMFQDVSQVYKIKRNIRNRIIRRFFQ